MTTNEIKKNDVIRATRMGNKTRGNYVIDRVIEIDARYIKVYAHREYGGQSGKFMMFDRRDAKVIRSYA